MTFPKHAADRTPEPLPPIDRARARARRTAAACRQFALPMVPSYSRRRRAPLARSDAIHGEELDSCGR
jgi:hypothetical protein